MARRRPVSAAAAAAAVAVVVCVSAAILTGALAHRSAAQVLAMPQVAAHRTAAQVIADLNVFSNPEWQRACDTLGAWKAETTDNALAERVYAAPCAAQATSTT